jgi:CHAT domain-containing protein
LLQNLRTETSPEAIRQAFAPLPETEEELKELAASLDAPTDSLYFGKAATETRVKGLDLTRYRIVAFATHGLLAGEFRGNAEPALVLTPPRKATPEDDGLLTASEIANLKLNADWVLLSACNTAGPAGRPGAEGLSGLAKSFFYAGSRALLVSHWSVNSYAAEQLTTGAMEALAREPGIGRAGALRRSMLTFLDGGLKDYLAHPYFWAAFVAVGEGGPGL